MKYTQTCKCCGTTIRAYSHNLNKPLVYALIQLYIYCNSKKLPANLQADLNLTKNQYNNFQKLRYFGLVEKIKGKSLWYITTNGTMFLKGEILIPNKAATLGKEILGINDYIWKYTEAKPKLISIFDILPERYKTREEYLSNI